MVENCCMFVFHPPLPAKFSWKENKLHDHVISMVSSLIDCRLQYSCLMLQKRKKILTCDKPLYLRHCSSSSRGGGGGGDVALLLLLGDYEISVFVKISNAGYPSLV